MSRSCWYGRKEKQAETKLWMRAKDIFLKCLTIKLLLLSNDFLDEARSPGEKKTSWYFKNFTTFLFIIFLSIFIIIIFAISLLHFKYFFYCINCFTFDQTFYCVFIFVKIFPFYYLKCVMDSSIFTALFFSFIQKPKVYACLFSCFAFRLVTALEDKFFFRLFHLVYEFYYLKNYLAHMLRAISREKEDYCIFIKTSNLFLFLHDYYTSFWFQHSCKIYFGLVAVFAEKIRRPGT